MYAKILMFISLWFLSIPLNAHQTDLSTTLLVEQGEDAWILQVRSALTAFEYEIEAAFGADSYQSADEFRSLVIEHVSQHTTISGNDGAKVVLDKGNVKLGHETSVTFQIKNLPSDLNTLEVENSTFSNIGRNKSALIVVKKGFEKDQFILNNENEHRVRLISNESKFIIAESLSRRDGIKLAVGIGLILFVASVLLYFSVIRDHDVPLSNAQSAMA